MTEYIQVLESLEKLYIQAIELCHKTNEQKPFEFWSECNFIRFIYKNYIAYSIQSAVCRMSNFKYGFEEFSVYDSEQSGRLLYSSLTFSQTKSERLKILEFRLTVVRWELGVQKALLQLSK